MLVRSIIVVSVALMVLASSGIVLMAQEQEVEIYTNSNDDPVYNVRAIDDIGRHVKHPAVFTLSRPCRITSITNYHWNGGQGSRPGSIRIVNVATQKAFGPYKAIGKPGMGDRPNCYWVVTPNVVLEPGKYVIDDSDLATWSINEKTGLCGITWVRGIPVLGTAPGRGNGWTLRETKIEYSSHPEGSGILIHGRNTATSHSSTKPDGIPLVYEFIHTWSEPPASMEPGSVIPLSVSVENRSFRGVLAASGHTEFSNSGKAASAGEAASVTINPSKPPTAAQASRKIEFKVPKGKQGDELWLTFGVSQGRGKGKKHYIYVFK